MITSKLPDIGTTVFTVMSQLANEHNALNLGQGFPEFDPDTKLIELVNKAMKEGYNQYPYMAGIGLLREQIAIKINHLYQANYDTYSEITVTSGATEAIWSAIMCSVGVGDEAIVLEPCYDCYAPTIRLAGGTPVFVPLTPPNENHTSFRVDWDRVEHAITDNTRLLILNFPHNPTGITLSTLDLDAIESIVARHEQLLILADEVYEHIVFNDLPFLSLATRPALVARTFIVSSFGKTYHTTGWKLGYCAAPAPLTAELRKVHQFVVFTVASPMQWAFAHYMQDPTSYEKMNSFYQLKHDILFEGLKNSRFKPIRSAGTFFLLADYSQISSLDELSFSRHLTTDYGVGVIPVSAFYKNPNHPEANNHLVRFCFAKKQDTLELAIARLQQV